MNIKTISKEWLVKNGISEDDPTFVSKLENLCNFVEDIIDYVSDGTIIDYEPEYDPNYGDNVECKCGHPYYRHFDTYDNMAPIGCKYCSHYTMSLDCTNHIENKYCPRFKAKDEV
jgi:hypothetical protein